MISFRVSPRGGIVLALVGAVVFSVLSGCAASAADKAWDQAAVTQLASKLTPITEKLYTAIFEQGQMIDMPSAMGAGDDYDDFKNTINKMNEQAMHLSSELKKGQGMAATRDTVEDLKEMNDDAKEFASEQFTTSPVNDDLAALEQIINQLRPYYGI
jgi:hypothetical protein